MVFPVDVNGCENWTWTEHQRTGAFELWCWRRLMWLSCIARRSNHSILMEISPEYPLEGLILKLKLQYFGHLMRRAASLEKTLMLGGIGGRRRRGRQRMGWLDGITNSQTHWISYAIQSSHPLSSPFSPTFRLSQHQGLFQWGSSSHQVAKVLEIPLQHQSCQCIFRVVSIRID